MLHSRFVFALVSVMAATSATAMAASAPPRDAGGTAGATALGARATTACVLAAGTVRATSFIWTPPEELTSMAWKIPIASCTSCPSSTLTLKTLTFRMRWFGPCEAQAQISIVGAKQGATCLEPDTTNVLCPAATYSIVGVANGSKTYTLPFLDGCCVSGDAFAMVRFTGLGDCAVGTSPGLASSTAPCVACEQFVTAKNIFPTSTEWCSIGAANETWFSIDSECCLTTRARTDTWGSVKTRYH